VEEYLRPQARYRHLFTPEADRPTLARLQEMADRNIERYGLLGPSGDEE
jgi:pyruvate ferredoxin oxidoreductase beta subunit